MQELDLALIALNDVIDNDVDFGEALRKIFQKDVSVRPLRSVVAGLVGCELRHHLLFTYLFEEMPLSQDEKRLAALATANHCYFRRLDDASVRSYLVEKMGEEKVALFNGYLTSDPKASLIPPAFAPRSTRFLSLHYNIPEWLLKIFLHYGYGNTIRTLRQFRKPYVQSIRVRSSLPNNSEANLLEKDPSAFKKSKVEDILFYQGKSPLRRLREFENGSVYLEKPATKWIFDKTKIEEPFEAFIYSSYHNVEPILEAIETYDSSIGLNIGVPDVDAFPIVQRTIKHGNLHNINYFGGGVESFEAAISRPQDLVMLFPESTNFDLIGSLPDYLLHFKRENIDGIINHERELLGAASKVVAEKGKLVYAIYTINKKEAHSLISHFLSENPEFHLIEEQQMFPSGELATAFYYAILEKDSSLAKKGTPLETLAPLTAPTKENPEISFEDSVEVPVQPLPKEELSINSKE